MSNRRGVRQRCSLYPTLYNIYVEKCIEEALQKTTDVIMGGERIKPIKYANDQ